MRGQGLADDPRGRLPAGEQGQAATGGQQPGRSQPTREVGFIGW